MQHSKSQALMFRKLEPGFADFSYKKIAYIARDNRTNCSARCQLGWNAPRQTATRFG